MLKNKIFALFTMMTTSYILQATGSTLSEQMLQAVFAGDYERSNNLLLDAACQSKTYVEIKALEIEILKFHIGKGADPRILKRDIFESLRLAAKSGDSHRLKLLLDQAAIRDCYEESIFFTLLYMAKNALTARVVLEHIEHSRFFHKAPFFICFRHAGPKILTLRKDLSQSDILEIKDDFLKHEHGPEAVKIRYSLLGQALDKVIKSLDDFNYSKNSKQVNQKIEILNTPKIRQALQILYTPEYCEVLRKKIKKTRNNNFCSIM